jgi:hypothetical protein
MANVPRPVHPLRTMKHVILILVLASPAFAQLNYVSQTRSVTATAGFIDAPHVSSAAGFGVFDQTLDITGPNPDDQPASNGFASQHSELLPGGISMNGRLGGTDNYRFGGFGEGSGYSLLDVSFSVAQPTSFHLSASESRNPGAATEWAVMLKQGSNALFDWRAQPFSSISITIDGTLEPGNYSIYSAWYDGWLGTGTGTRFSDYSMAFSVPEPCTFGLLGLGMLTMRRRTRRTGQIRSHLRHA